MFYIRFRSFLIGLFLVVGILLHVYEGISAAWYLYAAALILLATHFLMGSVRAAFGELRRGNIAQADLLISATKKPEWLIRPHRAYYHFTKGMIALQHEAFSDGEKHINQALELGLRSENDKALATLNLAHICFVQKRLTESRTHLKKAKEFKSNDLIISQKIEEMEKVLVHPYN